MKTLDAGQASLLASPQLSVVTLCKLTTYSDRSAGTVQATRYFSDGARLYDWANLGTVQQFEPWLLRLEPSRDTMNHLPSMTGIGIESALRRTRQITLRNWLPETGVYLFTTLRAENLEHARIEIAQVFIDRGAGASFNDMSALTGAEQTWLFRGEVASIGRVSEQEIVLELVAELPQIPWIYADAPTTNDPKDLGKPLPIVLGAAKRVPAIGWNVGFATTLAADATWDQTTLTLTDSTGFPASGMVKIGTEDILYATNTANVLSGCTRNANGTRKQSHKAGSFVLEIQTSSTWILSGIAASALTTLYVLSPINGSLVRVPSGFTPTLSDTATISGKTVASVTFTQTQLSTLLGSLHAAAAIETALAISAQPVVQHVVSGTTETQQVPVSGTAETRDGLTTTGVTVGDGDGATASFPALPVGTVSQRIEVYLGFSYSSETFSLRTTTSPFTGVFIGSASGTSPGWYQFTTTNLASSFGIWFDTPVGGSQRTIYEFRRFAQVGNPAPTLSQQTAVTELELAGFSIGFGVRFFADLSGPLASGSNYSVSNGTLLSKMPDLLRYILADLCGLGHGAIDASFSTLCGATFLDDNAHAANLSALGTDTLDVLAALTYEARANLVADERAAATTYRLLAALSTYAWPASVRTLSKWQNIEEEGRDAETIRTRFRHLYQWHPELGDGIEAFSAAVQTTVSAAEVKFGRRDADAVGLRTIEAAATATEIAGYYEQELSRAAGLWRINGASWIDAWDLERGDVVAFTPPWSSAKKARVIETTHRMDGLIDLRVVEVS